MPGATDTDAALAANVIVRASFDSVIPGKMKDTIDFQLFPWLTWFGFSFLFVTCE